jgi:hypothetical protein
MNFRAVRRNIYLCLEQITRDANCRVGFHDVDLFRRFIKRGGLLLAANLYAEVAIELPPHTHTICQEHARVCQDYVRS